MVCKLEALRQLLTITTVTITITLIVVIIFTIIITILFTKIICQRHDMSWIHKNILNFQMHCLFDSLNAFEIFCRALLHLILNINARLLCNALTSQFAT